MDLMLPPITHAAYKYILQVIPCLNVTINLSLAERHVDIPTKLFITKRTAVSKVYEISRQH